MTSENLISLKIKPEDLERAQKAITELQQILEPLLVSLGNDDRRRFVKMSEGSEPFVEETLTFARQNPEFMPPYVNTEELQIDFQAVKDLNTLFRPLQQLMGQLDDSIMLSGSEAYTAALAYLNSVKLAARMQVKNAKPIYEALNQRYSEASTKTKQ